MASTVVELSGGQEVEVRQLGVFELDSFDPDPLGPFTYMGHTLGQGDVEIEYDGSKWESPPAKPENPDPEERSPEWFELREYEAYYAWIAHENKRMAAAAEFHNEVAEHILSTCLNGDREKMVTEEDWSLVHSAALVPQLTQEDVAAALRITFPGYV